MASLSWLVDLGPSSILLQAAQALIAAAIFGLFRRRYASPALRPWTLAWLALAAHLAGLAAMADGAATRPATTAAMAAAAGATLLAGYVALGWLLLGTHAIATGAAAPPAVERGMLGLGVALTAVSTLPAAFDPDAGLVRFALRAGLFALICGGARILVGVALLRRQWPFGPGAVPGGRAAERPELGRLVVAFALVALGSFSLGAFGIRLAAAVAARSRGGPLTEVGPIAADAGGLFLLMSFVLALGLVIWLLEGEQRRAEHRAYHDPLTGLPNRQLLIDRLRHQVATSRRTRQPFAVLFIDVDRFKAVNDELGHAAGDRLLQGIAARLTAALREADTVARLGGDEFVVLATEIHEPDDVVAVADKLREVMLPPLVVDGRELRVTISVGAAVYPRHGLDADALLRASDAALYRAKEGGRDRVHLVVA